MQPKWDRRNNRIMDDSKYLLDQAQLLIQRLERISADSVWAHRSSGNRGALLRWVEQLEAQNNPVANKISLTAGDFQRLQCLIEASFDLLEKAAKEY